MRLPVLTCDEMLDVMAVVLGKRPRPKHRLAERGRIIQAACRTQPVLHPIRLEHITISIKLSCSSNNRGGWDTWFGEHPQAGMTGLRDVEQIVLI